jgi:hypothetical protein
MLIIIVQSYYLKLKELHLRIMPELEWLLLLSQLKGIWMEVNFLKKKKNRGKFTKSAKAAGQSVQEHAHSVMNNPKASTL